MTWWPRMDAHLVEPLLGPALLGIQLQHHPDRGAEELQLPDNVKASILRDLKYEQRRPYGNNNNLLF